MSWRCRCELSLWKKYFFKKLPVLTVLRIRDVLSRIYRSGTDHFLIPDPNIFSSRILHEKWNANLICSCFSCFQEQRL
jgi:hypothetical protein